MELPVTSGRSMWLALGLLPVILGQPVPASGVLRSGVSGNDTTPLCQLLESVAPGERRPATVRGILVSGYETTVLYDPDQPLCRLDVQPTTEVELSSKVPGGPGLAQTLVRSERRAYVTLRGVLWGPDQVRADNPALHPVVAYSQRRPHRYGHLGYSRTRFVVAEVLASAPVPASVRSMGALPDRPASALPILVEAALPLYPEAARSAGIHGEVVVDVTVEHGRVAATTVKSGDRVLAQAVLANLESWRFKPDVATRFTTTFVFELELRKTGGDRNTRLELNLPSAARLIVAQEAW